MQEQVRLLCRAAADGHAEEVAQLAAHATPSARHGGLLVAALRGDAAVLRALLDSGARADAQLRHTHCNILGALTIHAFVDTVAKFAPANFERALFKWVLRRSAAAAADSNTLRYGEAPTSSPQCRHFLGLQPACSTINPSPSPMPITARHASLCLCPAASHPSSSPRCACALRL
jgi:hypothetical protein